MDSAFCKPCTGRTKSSSFKSKSCAVEACDVGSTCVKHPLDDEAICRELQYDYITTYTYTCKYQLHCANPKDVHREPSAECPLIMNQYAVGWSFSCSMRSNVEPSCSTKDCEEGTESVIQGSEAVCSKFFNIPETVKMFYRSHMLNCQCHVLITATSKMERLSVPPVSFIVKN